MHLAFSAKHTYADMQHEAALVGLCYLLPTSTKKQPNAHLTLSKYRRKLTMSIVNNRLFNYMDHLSATWRILWFLQTQSQYVLVTLLPKHSTSFCPYFRLAVFTTEMLEYWVQASTRHEYFYAGF